MSWLDWHNENSLGFCSLFQWMCRVSFRTQCQGFSLWQHHQEKSSPCCRWLLLITQTPFQRHAQNINNQLTPKSLVEATYLWSPEAATCPTPNQPHPPPHPAAGPLPAPFTHKPDGSVKKKKNIPKRMGGGGGERSDRWEPPNFNWIHNATLSEQRTHCNHMGRQRTY